MKCYIYRVRVYKIYKRITKYFNIINGRKWYNNNEVIVLKRYKRNILIIVSFLLLYFSGFTGGYFYIKNVKQVESKEVQSVEGIKNIEKEKTLNASMNNNTVEENYKSEVESNNKSNTLEKSNNKKIAYLTFDDGPSGDITPEILKILDENEVKATFFTIGKMAEEHKELLKLQLKSGHAIGNHSYSHNMGQIYRNIEFFKADVAKGDETIRNILGESYKSNLFRFPGGSFERYKDPFKQYIKEIGKKYYDWNCLNGDAEGQGFTKEKLIERFKETFGGENKIIVLMHDAYGKKSTPEALPYIIKYLKENGYKFKTLEEYDN